MYIVKCTSDQALLEVAVAVAGGIDYEDKDAVHVGVEVAEHSFGQLELGAEVVRNIETRVAQVLACPQTVGQHERVHAEERNSRERGLGELSVLQIS